MYFLQVFSQIRLAFRAGVPTKHSSPIPSSSHLFSACGELKERKNVALWAGRFVYKRGAKPTREKSLPLAPLENTKRRKGSILE